MPVRLLRLYQRYRVININANIVGAGLLAIAIARLPVHHVSEWIGAEHKFLISLAAAGIDGVIDVAIYYLLHWLANHWRPLEPRGDADRPDWHPSFWRNATLVQFERIALTPVFYTIAVGLMYALQHAGMRASWAFVAGFSAAIIATRIIHTIWGLRTGRFERILAPQPAAASEAVGAGAPAGNGRDEQAA